LALGPGDGMRWTICIDGLTLISQSRGITRPPLKRLKRRQGYHSLSSPLLHSVPLSSSIPFLPSSPPLRNRPTYTQLGDLGKHCELPPARSEVSLSNLVHFNIKIWQLNGNNFNDVADSQLAKFRAVFHPA